MSDTFLYNPQLPVIKPGWPGNQVIKGKFLNQFKEADHSMWLALRWQLTRNPQRKEKKEDQWVPPVQVPREFLNSDQDGLVWLGHATFFIRIKGVTFLTDPLFYGVSWLKRRVPFPVSPEELPPIAYVLLSHGHFDHCDQPSLKALREHHTFEVLTSLNMSGLIQPWLPQTPMQEAGWYQQYKLPAGGPKVYFLPAYHWHKRGIIDNDRILWGSFMLQTAEQTLYFGADSGYQPHFSQIQALFPEIDICLLGVGAYKPAFIMQASHTSPDEAVQAFQDLRGKTFIPMHYGTFDLSDEPAGEPFRRLKELETQGKIPGTLAMPGIGQPFYF